MATFNLTSIGDAANIDDLQKMKSYLYKLQEQLRYMFNNLTPEDNYSPEALKQYVADGEKQSLIEVSLDQINLEMVKKDDVIASINLSEEGIGIKADKIRLEGLVTVNSYFKIGLDGSIEATNGKFSGKISASQMVSSDISSTAIKLGGAGSQGVLEVYNATDSLMGRWDRDGIYIRRGDIQVGDFYTSADETYIGGFKSYLASGSGAHYLATLDEEVGMGDHPNYAFWAGGSGSNPPFRVRKDNGKLYCSDMGSDWDGYSVGQAIKWIWDNWPGE